VKNDYPSQFKSDVTISYPSVQVNDQNRARQGPNKRCWARQRNDGYAFGDFVKEISEQIFPKNRKLTKKEWAEREKVKREAEEEQRRIGEEASLRAKIIACI
jgi:hypothetical protein